MISKALTDPYPLFNSENPDFKNLPKTIHPRSKVATVALSICLLAAVVTIAGGAIAYHLNQGGSLPDFLHRLDILKHVGDPYSTLLIAGGGLAFASIMGTLIYRAVYIQKSVKFPLHEATMSHDAFTIQKLIEDPSSLKIKDHLGRTALHIAVICNYFDVATSILDKDPTLLNETDTEGNTLLHAAVKYGHLSIVEKLLSMDETLAKAKNAKGETALHIAATSIKKWASPIAKELIESGASLEQVNNQGQTPLHIAAIAENPAIWDYLIANVKIETLIEIAAKTGDIETLKRLKESKTDLKAKIPNSETPLQIAIKNKQEKAALYLIQNAWTNEPNDEGRPPLHEAAYQGMTALIEPIFIHGAGGPDLAKDKDSNYLTAAYIAIQNGHSDVFKKIITHGYNVGYHLIQCEGLTYPQLAAIKDNAEVIQFMIDRDPYPHKLKNFYMEWLHLCIEHNATQTAKVLLKTGDIKINPVPAEEGKRPTLLDRTLKLDRGEILRAMIQNELLKIDENLVLRAFLGNSGEAVKVLFEEGAKDKTTWNPLQGIILNNARALYKKEQAVIAILESGVSIWEKDSSMILHECIIAGYTGLAEYLIVHNVIDIHLKHEGMTALERAQRFKHEGLVQLLKEKSEQPKTS